MLSITATYRQLGLTRVPLFKLQPAPMLSIITPCPRAVYDARFLTLPRCNVGPADLVNRRFIATAPSRLWVADLTCVLSLGLRISKPTDDGQSSPVYIGTQPRAEAEHESTHDDDLEGWPGIHPGFGERKCPNTSA